jgi:hypothetical protein
MVVNDANAAVYIASVGFKDGNIIHVGFDCSAFYQDERVRMPSAVLGVDDAETFIGHGVGLAFGPAATAASLF